MRPELFFIPGTNMPISSYGAMVAISFLGGTYWMIRNARRLKADEDIVLNLAFLALIFSTIGAHTFYVVHYWDTQYAHRPLTALNPFSGGFEFYGGFIGAFVPCFLYTWYKKLSIRIYADLVAPALLFGMGVGRIGCYLHGCCWGGACSPDLAWAVQFPVSSPPFIRQWEERQVTLPEEFIVTDTTGLLYNDATHQVGLVPRHLVNLTEPTLDFLEKTVDRLEKAVTEAEATGDALKIQTAQSDLYPYESYLAHLNRYGLKPGDMQAIVEANQYLGIHVHPSQIYAAVGPLILACLTHVLLMRRKRHGIVLIVGYGLYAIQRFIEEALRSDNPHDTLWGLTASQGVSIGILAVCLLAYLYLLTRPLKSPLPARPAPKKSEQDTPAEPTPAT